MKDINYKELPEKEKRKLQEEFHENDLNYLSSFAFESGTIKEEDLDDLNKAIDKRVSGISSGFNLNVIIALVIGVLIGGAIFYFWPEKNAKPISEKENIQPQNNNSSQGNIQQTTIDSSSAEIPKPHAKEHFNISESGEHLSLSSPMENMEIKDINSIEVKSITPTDPEEILNYIPNSSVIYIHDLKVANYKGYYFKNSDNIDIRDNGLSAQFSNKEETNNLNKRMEDKDYYAHEIIKDALDAFNKKQYVASIDLLSLLNNYNKDDVNTQFYLGMSHFYLGNYTKATKFLEAAENNSINIFLQESEFYSALSMKKSGKIDEAKNLFKKIAGKKLFYAARATEELN
jgi:hypothetical protein